MSNFIKIATLFFTLVSLSVLHAKEKESKEGKESVGTVIGIDLGE